MLALLISPLVTALSIARERELGTFDVRNIGRVNAALPPTLHPVRVAAWYSTPDADLALDDERGPAMTPLRWLDSGGDAARLVPIAAGL